GLVQRQRAEAGGDGNLEQSGVGAPPGSVGPDERYGGSQSQENAAGGLQPEELAEGRAGLGGGSGRGVLSHAAGAAPGRWGRSHRRAQEKRLLEGTTSRP